MPDAKVNALRERFGVPPIVFTPTASGKVWGGVSGLGNKIARAGNTGPGQAEAHANARAAFLDWLAEAYPTAVEAMAAALDAADVRRAAQLGQTEDERGFFSNLFDLANTVLPSYLQYQQQRDVLDIQLARAQQGLPPLETGQYAPSVQIGLDDETVSRLGQEAYARAQTMASGFLSGPTLPIMLGVGGLLAFMMLNKKGRRRGRR